MTDRPILRKALQRCIDERLTFAAFRRPGLPVQLWAQRTPDLETIDGAVLLGLNQVFLIAPFDLDHKHIPFIRADVELLFGEIGPDIARLEECEGMFSPVIEPPAPTDAHHFQAAVNAAKEACIKHELNKVVLSRLLDAKLDMGSLPELFLRATRADADTLVVMAHTPQHGLWMGASPERLVREEADRVRVDAIAATRPAHAVPPRISAWGAKELDEQEQVMQHVHRTFVGLDMQDIVVRGPEVMNAGPVVHLRSTVEADLGTSLLGDLVLALHPTPAVCGSPTDKAYAFIKAHEAHDRALYAGFWGPWNAEGPTELFVNLRCMQIHPGKAQLYVGAGITAGSDAEREWAETQHKADTWLRLVEPLEAIG